MARNARRGFQAVPFQHSLSLGTLADNTVTKGSPLTFGEDAFIISVDASWAIRNQVAGESPVEVGWAHSDLSVSEIEEALQAEITDPDDIIARERARRPVRRVGTFEAVTADEVLFDGAQRRRKIGFSVGDGMSLDFWAVNRSGAALTVGAANVEVQGTMFLRWQR